MLSYFLVYLPDRYDHQQRLLPYVLSFINDAMPCVQSAALQCIEKCGLQYECEHPDEVIERRQLGVDGEDGIDYDCGLPPPFARRPGLGARLFVRSNTSRFFLTALGELSNWRERTRKRSAELLLILAVYCEEHLTKDFQHALASIAKAIDVEKTSRHENDHLMTLDTIRQVLRLMAKYVDPGTYLPLICPRMLGSDSSAASACNSSIYATILASLIEGAPLSGLMPRWLTLASLLSGADCIGQFSGTQTRKECLNALLILMERVTSSEEDTRTLIAHFADNSGERAKVQTVVSSATRELLDLKSGTGKDIARVLGQCLGLLSKVKAAMMDQCNK